MKIAKDKTPKRIADDDPLVKQSTELNGKHLKDQVRSLFRGVFSAEESLWNVSYSALVESNRFFSALVSSYRGQGVCLLYVLYVATRLGCLGFFLAMFLSARYPADDGSCAKQIRLAQV
jgi:hypothetical protein